MNEKEIAALRRRFRKDKSNISHVCGCFVNENKEIIAEFEHSLGLMPEDEADQLLLVLKKVLSGSVGRNLWEIEFGTEQVMSGEEHRLLSELRSTCLKDKELVRQFFEKIIASLAVEGNYVILLAHDRYDVPSYSADGERLESCESFPYIIGCICPIKSGKPNLCYHVPDNCFRSVCAETLLAKPELGFLFPAFEDHGANLYKALYYTKDLGNSHREMAEVLFHSELPMPAVEQKQTFTRILEESMEEDCSLKVVRSVHAQVCGMMDVPREDPEAEVLQVTKDGAGDMLRYCGVPEERVEVFEKKYEEAFGADTCLNPKNIADTKRVRVKTPEVEIRVAPNCGEVLETRVIDGVRYIMIRADGDVEVNGVSVHI